MTNKKHNQFLKNYKTALSFKLNYLDFPPLLNSNVSKSVPSVSSSLLCKIVSRSFTNKVSTLSFTSLTKASNKCFLRTTCFCPGNFGPKHLYNPSQFLVSHLARKVLTKLKHFVICKSVLPFEAFAVNVNFAPVSVYQRVHVVRSVFFFFHPHTSIKPLFTTVNLVRPVTVYNVKPVHSAGHIRRMFPSVHCTTSIHRNLSYRRHENVRRGNCHHQIYFLLLVLNIIFNL